jgi:hypothetical protein
VTRAGRLILAGFAALSLVSSVAASFAQIPPAVPALPDAERRTTYTLTAQTCACSVGFAIFGDGTDYQSWVEVFFNGTRVNYNDATFGWTITSPTGTLGLIPRPITDAVLTFTNPQTGTVQIVGARRPRRMVQIQEGRGVAARDFNQAFTDIVAQNRETWDKTNDVTGRAILAPPGEIIALLPKAASRANQGACFDSSGNLINCVNIPISSIIAGTGISLTGTGPTTISTNLSAGAGIALSGTNPQQIATNLSAGAGIAISGSNPQTISAVPIAPAYFVATTGNDSNNCLTIGTQCLTLPHVAGLINATGSVAPTTINIGAGSFAGATFTYGNITLVGAGSGSTTITDSSNPGASLLVESPAKLGVSGIRVQNSTGSDIWALYGGVANINSDVVLGPAPTARLACQDNGATIYGNANFTVDGGAGSTTVFLLANCAMRFFGGPPVLTFTNSPVFSEIVDAINNSVFKSGAMQFVGGASVTNRYALSQNSTVDQEQNATEWPGGLQGAVSGGAVFYDAGPTFTGVIGPGTNQLTVSGMAAGLGALGIGNEINGAGITPHFYKITAFGTGTGLNGTYTLNNTGSVSSEQMTASSIYPCIDSVALCPVVQSAPTGLGVGGTASVSNDAFGGDYAGRVTLTAGSSGTAASGVVFVILHSIMQNCSASLSATGTGILASVAPALGNNGAFRWLEIAWTNAAALTASGTYNINYSCR